MPFIVYDTSSPNTSIKYLSVELDFSGYVPKWNLPYSVDFIVLQLCSNTRKVWRYQGGNQIPLI